MLLLVYSGFSSKQIPKLTIKSKKRNGIKMIETTVESSMHELAKQFFSSLGTDLSKNAIQVIENKSNKFKFIFEEKILIFGWINIFLRRSDMKIGQRVKFIGTIKGFILLMHLLGGMMRQQILYPFKV